MKVLITENGPILGTFDKTAEGDYFERSGCAVVPPSSPARTWRLFSLWLRLRSEDSSPCK